MGEKALFIRSAKNSAVYSDLSAQTHYGAIPILARTRIMAVSDLPAAGAISADEALDVRRRIYAHDPLTPADMDLVFRTAQRSEGHNSIEWTNLFAEAVTDYVVHQNDPADYIPQEKADWLAAKLKDIGGIATASEFAMIVDMMKSALGVPPSLSAFVLREIETAIVSGRRNAIGGGDHAAGAVTKADVEALRTTLYAATTGSVGHVTREEAEALFDIAHATAHGTCDPAFDDLFARAVGNYLMAICWHEPSRDQALDREHWLDRRETLLQFLSHRPAPGQEETFGALTKSPFEQEEADLAALDRQDAAARAESEQITGPEADWVIAHLTRQGPLTSAETHLLKWLGDEASALPPKLRALIETANDVRARAA